MLILLIIPVMQIVSFFIALQLITGKLFKFKEGLLILGVTAISAPLFFYFGYLTVLVFMLTYVVALIWKRYPFLYAVIIALMIFILGVMTDTVLEILLRLLYGFSYISMTEDLSPVVIYAVYFIVITVVCSYCIRKVFVKFNLELFLRQTKYSFIVMSLLLLTLAIFYTNIYFSSISGFDKDALHFNSILFAIYFIILLVTLYSIIQTAIKELKMKNQQEQLEQLQEYTNTLEVLHNEMRVFRHDYINIISSLAGYIEENDMAALKTYFENNIVSVNKTIESNNYKISSLQNIEITELKGLIAIKVIRAQELKIDAIVEVVEKINHINMKSIDLCKVVGILLDNAVEAAQASKVKSIRLACVKKADAILIVFANSVPDDMPPIYKIFEQGFSTKGDKRGLGLSSLRDTLQGYSNVSLDTKLTDCEFIQELEIV